MLCTKVSYVSEKHGHAATIHDMGIYPPAFENLAGRFDVSICSLGMLVNILPTVAENGIEIIKCPKSCFF